MKQFLHRDLWKAVLWYIILLAISTLFFSLIYYLAAIQNDLFFPIDKIAPGSYIDWLYFSIMVFFGTVDFDNAEGIIKLIVIIQHFINSIILPIITGIIFYFILNRKPSIIFPEHLIIRKRTSESSKGKLTLSALIANKGKNKIYNVTCQLVFIYYVKSRNGIIAQNGETSFAHSVPYIANFYRFSYELETFPSVLLKHILEREGMNKNASILLIVNGKFGGFGESFSVEEIYKMSDVTIAKESEKIRTYKDDGYGNIVGS